MSAKIHLATTQIWNYFWRNYKYFDDNEALIANNSDNGMSLYVTASGYYPQLIVYNADGKPLVWRVVRQAEECNLAAVFLVSHFIVGNVDKDEQTTDAETPAKVEEPQVDEEEDEEQKILDKIYEREDELELAMNDLLVKVFCEDSREIIEEAYGKGIVKDVLDDFLQYLYDVHGISVYRPTLITDDKTGEEVLAEFPYGWDDAEDDADK